MVIAKFFSSTQRYAPLITDIKKKNKNNRLHCVLEVRNGKDVFGQLAQLPAKAHSFCYGLFTQVSRKLSLGLNEVLYNVLSNTNIFPMLK